MAKPSPISPTHQKILLYNSLALEAKANGNHHESIIHLKKALKIAPKLTPLLNNIAGIYRETGQIDKSKKYYLESLDAIKSPQTYHDLASLYFSVNELRLAEKYYRAALKIDPKNPSHSYQLGHVFTKQNNLEEALFFYQKTYDINPNFLLVGACIFITKRKLCDWSDLKKINAVLNKNLQEDTLGSVIRTENKKTNLFVAQKNSLELVALNQKIKPTTPHYHHDKIRVGYVSGNLGDHPVGYMTESVLRYHDHNKFEIYTYSHGKNDNSAIRKNIEKYSTHFIDLNSLKDEEAAAKVRADEIDILVDLTGFTDGHRLKIFAHHPATIQITWAGLLGTIGTNFIEYNLVDKVVAPEKESKYFTEKLLYIEPSYYLSREIKNKTFKFGKSDFNLPQKQFIFGVFNQMYKITPEIWQVWMNILKSTPDSILWLWEQNPTAKKNLIFSAVKTKVDPKRLHFCPNMSSDDYLDRLGLANLVLDTPVYGGGATTYLSLLRGVPVLTIYGKHLASRFTSSILTQFNLSELITNSFQDYQNLAIKLATDPELLNSIKSKIKTPNYRQKIKNLETIFKDLILNENK